MATCHVCHEPLSLPNDCNYCGEYYCPAHRLPEKHHCPNLDRVHSLGPEFRGGLSPHESREDRSTATKVAIGLAIVALIVIGIVLLL